MYLALLRLSHVSLGDDELRFALTMILRLFMIQMIVALKTQTVTSSLKTPAAISFRRDGGETLASFINDGAVNLFTMKQKLETTSTGIEVTGTCVATEFSGLEQV